MADFSAEAVRNAIADAQKGASSATEHEAAEAKIELEVWPPPTTPPIPETNAVLTRLLLGPREHPGCHEVDGGWRVIDCVDALG